MKIVAIITGLLISASVVAACGAKEKEPEPSTGLGLSAGPGISVPEAISSGLDGPLLVSGFLFVEGGATDVVRICQALAESAPPQCGGSSLVVEGLDLNNIGGLKSEGVVTWTEGTVQLLGTVEGSVLRISNLLQ